jgi:hypothetical protein
MRIGTFGSFMGERLGRTKTCLDFYVYHFLGEEENLCGSSLL